MTISVNQLEEARRALEAPLFADLAGDAAVSFEFFPPKTEEQRVQLDAAVSRLKKSEPDYVSVTFGAGGSTLS
jgi:methylenetetrahydrofolate reductase (NADPH)